MEINVLHREMKINEILNEINGISKESDEMPREINRIIGKWTLCHSDEIPEKIYEILQEINESLQDKYELVTEIDDIH